MRVRKPGVQRRKADLGAVAEQEEDEGEVEQSRVERRHMRDQARPQHPLHAFADDWPGGHVDEDRAEQGERNADAAEDKIFPRRLDRLLRAIDADHQHRRQRGELDRHPHQSDIVGDQREVHRKQEELIHRVVKAQMHRRQPPRLDLVRDIGRAEHARGKADERIEHDEDDVEFVDENVGVRLWSGGRQRDRGEEGNECGRDVDRGGEPIGG